MSHNAPRRALRRDPRRHPADDERWTRGEHVRDRWSQEAREMDDDRRASRQRADGEQDDRGEALRRAWGEIERPRPRFAVARTAPREARRDWSETYDERTGAGAWESSGVEPQEFGGHHDAGDHREWDDIGPRRGGLPSRRAPLAAGRDGDLLHGGDASHWSRRGERQSRYIGKGPRGYVRSDERILDDVHERLAHGFLDASDIDVKVTDGTITLTGTAEHKAARRMAEDLVEDVVGAKEVDNRLKLRRDTTSAAAGGARGSGSGDDGHDVASDRDDPHGKSRAPGKRAHA